MGGRGSYAENNNQQISIDEMIFGDEIRTIKEQTENEREKYISENMYVFGKTPVGRKQTLMKRCACCKEYTLPEHSIYIQCPLCGWIDDPAQNENPTLAAGRNPISLTEARKRWTVSREVIKKDS